MPLGLTRQRYRFVLAGFLGGGLAMAFAQPDLGDARSPAPPPGPYTSMTLVDMPVEEAEGLNFPPLDYGQSLEASQVPDHTGETPEPESAQTPSGEPALEDSAYPPLEEPVGSEQPPARVLPESLAEEAVPTEPAVVAPAPAVPPAAGPERGPAISTRPPGIAQPAEPEGTYPPLEPEGPMAVEGPGVPTPQRGIPQSREPISTPAVTPPDGARAGDGPQPDVPETTARQAPPAARTAPTPSPGYGYPGYQPPRPYYPGARGWGQAPGAMGIPAQPPQGQSGSSPQGQAPQGRSAPGYPGMYYPPRGYAPYYPPGPGQGSVSGGQR